MKKVPYILLFAIIVITVSACSTCKVVKASPIQEIQFGYGGGVTQKVETYKLNRKGEIFKAKEKVAVVTKEELCDIFQQAANLGKPINDPTNTFTFIRIVTNEGVEYYCWDGVSSLTLSRFYDKLANFLSK